MEESSDEDIIRFDVAGNEKWSMKGNTLETANTGGSLFVGAGAGLNDDLTNNYNTFIGDSAGFGLYTTGTSNVAIGYRALYTGGSSNTVVGRESMYGGTAGGFANSTLGFRTLYSNTTGDYNTAIGYFALADNTTGYSNIAIGRNSMNAGTSGHSNIALGESSLANTNGDYSIAIGRSAMSADSTGSENVAVGYQAFQYNGSGEYNVAVGSGALKGGVGGVYSSGYNNVAVGYGALDRNVSGSSNVAVGSHALDDNETGVENIAIGWNALSGLTSGNHNIAIGSNLGTGGAVTYQSVVMGWQVPGAGDNTMRLGGPIFTSVGGYSAWTNLSDGRFKENVEENVVGLDFIMKLRPVTYNINMDALARFNGVPDTERLYKDEKVKANELQSGFIAQEVEAAANSVGYDFHGVDKPKIESSHYGLRYAEFVVPMVKAMQEQQNMIEELKAENDRQQQLIERLLLELHR